MQDELNHNCGLCVTHTLHDAYSMIKSLQHRGREAAGLAAIGDGRIDVIKWKGPVNRFDLTDLYKIFPGPSYHTYMAHVRYATRGRKDKILEDAHPHTIGGQRVNRESHILITNCEAVAVHNGQVNPPYLEGASENTEPSCDTEALIRLYMQLGERELLRRIPGSYTIAIGDRQRSEVIVLRDRTGIKPGVLGWKDGKYGIASEDIAFRKNGGSFVEDLEPGAIYYLGAEGSHRKEGVVKARKAHCFFEWNYLADIDTVMNGLSVRRVRETLGEALAKELRLQDIDLVTFLPRSPEVAARRYAESLGLPFRPVFYKMRGERSFQGSTKDERKSSIVQNLHLLPNVEELMGKVLVTIDDSIVRGNNSRRERGLLYEQAGVSVAHHVNYSPPIGIVGDDGVPRGCLFGVDMPPDDDFIARDRTPEQVSEEMEMPVHYITLEGMLGAFERLGMPREELCYYCIGGPHPFEEVSD